MDDQSVKEIQDELLVLLKKFHKICEDNGIKYSLYAGTLLGAVREKGFIPWDDDVDVSFTRAEYNRFREVITKENIDPEIEFDEFSRTFPQLWMRREGKPVVWLDIFIYDFITDNKFFQKVKFAGIAFYLGVMKDKEALILTKERGLYKGPKYAFIYLLHLIGKPFSNEYKRKRADKFHQRYAGKKNLIHRANDRYIGVKQLHPKSAMEAYITVPFEDTEFMITKDYHRILVASYDEDYMTPRRPAEGEESMHSAARNLQ